MPLLKLDIRPIPQLYGDSYDFNPDSGLKGSCLSASFEMLLDWKRGCQGPRVPGYSSFKNTGVNLTKQGHPNGNLMTHLMWNQATLHCHIYCSACRLVKFIGLGVEDGGCGLATRTVSIQAPSPEINEKVISVPDQQGYARKIKNSIRKNRPLIALIDGAAFEHLQPPEYFVGEPNKRRPFKDLQKSRIVERETKDGHAVVIAGIYTPPPIGMNHDSLPSLFPSQDIMLNELLILDPAPSIQLEQNPRWMYDRNLPASDPNFHVHRVVMRDFIQYLKPTRGLITFDN